MIKIGPVSLEKFSGRKQELQRLEKIKQDYLKGYRRNLAVIGPLTIGKTSLILKYLHEGLKDELFPIYINLEEGFLKESFYGFLLFFLRRFSGVEYELSITGIQDIAEVIEEEYPFLATQIKNIESALKATNSKAVLESIFKLPRLIGKAFGKNCLFILDEFFGLEKLKVDSWMQLLREHIMLDTHTLFILISSEVERAKSALNAELSLLFGNFELIELKNFSYQESLEFLMERIEGIKYQKEALNSLINLTEGVPLYLDLLSNWIRENLSVLDWEGLMLSLKENILENKGFLYRYFQEKLNLSPGMRRPQEFLSFITEIARGNLRRRELIKKVNLSFFPCHHRSLNGFLQKRGSFYKFKDSLFRIWLLYAYRADLMGLKFNLDNQFDSLYNEIKNLGSYLNYFNRKDLLRVIESLFLRFDSEFIEIESKKKLLPKFTRIEEIKSSSDYSILKGVKKNRGIWAIVVFPSPVEEEKVYKLLSEFKGKRAEFSQRVAISISEIDENSKSILKAKGFWFWDLEFLNELMNFYGISWIERG